MNVMNELDSIYDSLELTKADPPIGDTTLRNPLILRMFEVVNNAEPDTTGFCKLMLRERSALGFRSGTLSPTSFLAGVLQSDSWHVRQSLIVSVEKRMPACLSLAIKSFKPITPVISAIPSIPPMIITYWSYMIVLNELVLISSSHSSAPHLAGVLTFTDNRTIRVGGTICELSSGHQTCVVPRDWFLMYSDIISGRGEILLTSFLCDHWGTDPTLLWIEFAKIFSLGDDILYHQGQAAYKRFKLLEPYAIRMLLEYDSMNLFPSSFPDYINNELLEFDDTATRKFFKYLSVVSTSPERIAEIFGLFRMWGHPILDTYKSRDRVKRIATAIKVIDRSTSEFVEIAFKKQLCIGHFKRHGKWPNLDVSQLSLQSEIRKAIEFGISINMFSKTYRDNDWLLVKGCKTFDFPLSLNLATLLADKSHSLNRTELEETIRNTRRCGKAQQRRVVLSFLNKQTPTVEEIIKEFSSGNLNPDYLVFGLREKEREVSVWARLFGLMTLPCRFYFVLTEQLLTNDVVPLFPETTVGDSLITIRKKKRRIYQAMRADGSHVIGVINLDFEKWNLNMRYESTEPAFGFLDQLYGSNYLFRNSHKIFSKSIMYLCHGVHPIYTHAQGVIKPLTGENVWVNHLGGIEGLRQKGWTLMTIAILKELADRERLTVQLLGQGDNQVLCVNLNVLDRSEGAINAARSKFEQFKSKVFSLFAALQLPIKPEETWTSSQLFTYGKDIYFRGKRLGLIAKRASRCNFLNNEGYPSFSEYVGSISSSISTLNDECNSAIVPWMMNAVNLCHLIRCINRHHPLLRRPLIDVGKLSAAYTLFSKSNKQQLSILFKGNWEKVLKFFLLGKSVLTTVPSVVGYDLLTHGFPDTLSLGLTWAYQFLDDAEFSEIAFKIINPNLDPNPNPLQLCEDPCSIPIQVPATVRNRVRSCVSSFLANPMNIKNENFKKFFQISLCQQDKIAAVLFSMQPCNPRLMSDLISATPIGQATAIVSQISTTTTLSKLMYLYHGDVLTHRLINFEIEWLNSLYDRIMSPLKSKMRFRCPTVHARYLRETGWRKELVGVTVPFSLHYIKFSKEQPESDSFIIIRHSGEARAHLLMEPGPFPEYHGSQTSEKTTPLNLPSHANVSPLLYRPIRLLRLLGWVTLRDSNLGALIEAIYSASTDVPSAVFNQDYGEVSGSVEHRYEDSRTSHRLTTAGGWLSPSHVIVTLSQWKEYSKGSKNKTLHFQELILSHTRKLYEQLLLSQSAQPRIRWGSIACPECVIDTYEGFYDLPQGTVRLSIPSFPDLDTLYLRSSLLKLRFPISIGGWVETTDINCHSASFLSGICANLDSYKLRPGVIERLNPILVIHGFACALISHYCYRRLSDSEKVFQVSDSMLVKISRKTLNTDLHLFEPIELLFQYSSLLSYLIQEYGISAMPHEIPLSPDTRRAAARRCVALSIRHLISRPNYMDNSLDPFVTSAYRQYSQKLFIHFLSYVVACNPFSITSSVTRRLVEVSQLLQDSMSPVTVSLDLIARPFSGSSISAIIRKIRLVPCTLEVLIKHLDVLPHIPVTSLISGIPSVESQAVCIPVLIRRHNAPIILVCPSFTVPDLDQSILHRAFKPVSEPTGAWYKWYDILKHTNVTLSRPACLGDGAGGLARLCYDLSALDPHKKTVYYSTLPLSKRADEFSYEEFNPSALIGLPCVEGREALLTGIGDLSCSESVYRLIHELRSYRPTVITCDAEHNNRPSNTKWIVHNLILIFKEVEVPLIFKGYAFPRTAIRWVLTTLVQNQILPEVLTTPFSPEKSSEIFIYLKKGITNIYYEAYLSEYETHFPCYPVELSLWRLPILYSTLNYPFPEEIVRFNLPKVCTLNCLCTRVIHYTETQVSSLKYFPDAGRKGVGRVQYISSTSLGWLTAAHYTLYAIHTHRKWYQFLSSDQLVLFLDVRKERVVSDIKPLSSQSRLYRIKVDRHIRQVFRHWISIVSYLTLTKGALY